MSLETERKQLQGQLSDMQTKIEFAENEFEARRLSKECGQLRRKVRNIQQKLFKRKKKVENILKSMEN